MATDTLPTDPACAKALAAAYWEGAFALEDLANDADRLSETAYALACSMSFEERAQHAFYLIGEASERLREKMKVQEDKLSTLSAKHREG